MSWKVVKLPEITKAIFAGGDVDKNNLSNIRTAEFPYPIYTNGETNNGLYGFTNVYRVSEPALTVSARGTIGFTCIRNEPYYPAVRLINIVPNDNTDIKYLYYFIKSKTVGSTGSSIPQLTVPMVKEFEIGLPELLSEQQQIVEKLDTAFDLIDRAKANIEKNIQNAKELFQSKLNQVFSEKGEDWKEMKLESVCTLLNGRAYNRQELLSDGKYRVLRVGNFFTNKHWYYSDLELDENKYCDKGDLLYAWSASFGPRIWQEEKVIYHYHIWKVLPNDFIKKDFLYILLDWDKEKIKKESGAGTTMVHVSKGSMEKRVLPIPPIALQEKIVAQVEQLLIQTELLQQKYQQKLANLEELKKSILEKAFRAELL